MKRYFNTKEAAERHLERRRKSAIKRIQKRDDVILQDFSKVYQDFKWRLTKGDIIGDTGLEMWTSTQTNELKWFTQLEILTKQMKEYLDKLPNMMKIDEDSKEPEWRNETHFLSRLNGEIMERNGRKTLNEDPSPDNPQWAGFALVAEAFRSNTEIRDTNPVIYLYQQWNYPKDYIDMIFEEFGNSFDESNSFLNKLDGYDGNLNKKTRDAWETFCDDNDISSGPCTDKFAEFIEV